MKIGYDLKVWQAYNLKQSIEINPVTHTHCLICGSTGSGKSYALKWLLRNLVTTEKVKLTFLNFKNSSDLKFMKGKIDYYTVNDCLKGFDDYYNQFKETQKKAEEYNGILHILIFDEYPAFLSYLSTIDKKKFAEIQTKMSELLMLARSYGFGVWIVMQRPDAKWLPDGARDNIHTIISVGNLSKEGKQMLFSGYDLEDIEFSVGEGMVRRDAVGLKYVKYPRILDTAALEREILENLSSK